MKIEKVYVAGPMFNCKEIEELLEIGRVLDNAGYQTFVPPRDGFVYSEIVKKIQDEHNFSAEDANRISLKLVAYLDIYMICNVCDACVVNLNGRVPDEGTVVEAAICFRSERPLVLYKNDSRSLINGKDSPMILGLAGFKVTKSIEDIPRMLKELESLNTSEYQKIMRNASKIFENYDSDRGLGDLIKLGICLL